MRRQSQAPPRNLRPWQLESPSQTPAQLGSAKKRSERQGGPPLRGTRHQARCRAPMSRSGTLHRAYLRVACDLGSVRCRPPSRPKAPLQPSLRRPLARRRSSRRLYPVDVASPHAGRNWAGRPRSGPTRNGAARPSRPTGGCRCEQAWQCVPFRKSPDGGSAARGHDYANRCCSRPVA
jgi:hypothetical protein